eukprot:Rhum_TRINITY_DN19457_c0_g1::Rhum_TRINITY_DN19457_c0_g1_i1::g.170061::m.170061
MDQLPPDALERVMRFLDWREAGRLRAVSAFWSRCAVAARGDEFGWASEARRVDTTEHRGVVPLHLFVEEGDGCVPARLMVQTHGEDEEGNSNGTQYAEVAGAKGSKVMVGDDVFWWCVSKTRLFQIVLHPAQSPRFQEVRVPLGTRGFDVTVHIQDLDTVFGDVVGKILDYSTSLPFAAYHSFSASILLRVGNVAARIDTRTRAVDRHEYDEDAVALWAGMESCTYVTTRSTLIIMNGVKALEIAADRPGELVRLPGMCYGANPQGTRVVWTRNAAKSSCILGDRRGSGVRLGGGGGEVVVRWTVQELNQAVFRRSTHVRLFLMDVCLTDEGVVACLVCPAGHLPPVAVFLCSSVSCCPLSCISLTGDTLPKAYSPFQFSIDVMYPPTFAVKFFGRRAQGLSVLLPLGQNSNCYAVVHITTPLADALLP